jgi:hypothetical protein
MRKRLGTALLGLSLFALLGAGQLAWQGRELATPAQAQAPSCAGSSDASGVADANGFVQIDVGNRVVTYFCVGTSNGFIGPFTANGTVGNGCFVVSGIGTAVAKVTTTFQPTGSTCPTVLRLDVGAAQVGVATATPTAAATTTATMTPTATSTTGTATASPTATRTSTPTPFVPTPTLFPPTITPAQVSTATAAVSATAAASVVPRPPATGQGTDGGSDTGRLMLLVFGVLIAAGAGGVVVARQNREQRD